VSKLIDTINTQTPNIIETGLARRVGEPRGRHGLEGETLDQSGFSAARTGVGAIAGFFQM
jgi:hypothetical protein